MGTLRALFAIAVVFAHSYGFALVGGQNAVQLFYMISGFLISYVLVERKAYTNISSFYINRYLRLYPIYFVVAILSFFAFTSGLPVGKEFFKVYHDSPLSANILLIFSNITIFLQDWVMFSGVKNNQLVFVTNFRESDVVLYPGLLLRQGWTLGVELAFYLIAPFILSRKWVLLLLLALSILLRLYLIDIDLKNDPWSYRFFPTELAMFLLGSLAHQVLLPYYKEKLSAERIKIYSNISTYILIFITLVYWLIPIHELIKTAILFLTFLILMPLTFIFQSNSKWDKWIGDLSYPIYICHLLVIFIVGAAFDKIGIDYHNKRLVAWISVIFSIGMAIVLNNYIAKPIELLRNRFKIQIKA